ncbi:MAG: insulinase family protein, partial [Pseudomonadota bacterium]
MTRPLFERPISYLCASALLSALLVVTPGPSSEAAVFNPETFTLDNGMQVVVITNRRAPVVTHHVWYRIGSSDSPPGK